MASTVASEPVQIQKLVDERQKCRGVTHPAVVNEIQQDNDAEIDSDFDVMYMIFETSEESKPEFDSLNRLASKGTLDPIRRTTSTGPPAATKQKKIFVRARTMP